ncbi:TetR family transcriptional regulator [Actinoplanes lutulentus]|uniref:TetR family transcriptional regulator n=1 Tax=Actinoplanes lutulentus TaxID=1287878 RepID=A0A327Z2E2_9ACTN|nr:TetR/AcrR family transcriptional regulator [Actinoplanes lutulentus]RAK28774.1 TetR family transcriptional regulator [Actinoplanes lutulentus]
MPAPIDRDVRVREIRDAAFRLLSERGPAALTIRGLATELGGSSTLVTHFFANRAELLKGITESAIEDYDEEIAQLEQGADARQRLRILLEWMLPLDEEQVRAERGRVMLIGHAESDLNVGEFFVAMDRKMRELLRSHLTGLVDEEDVDETVEFLRVFTNGVVLSVAEHPTLWDTKRQQKLLQHTLELLGVA